MSRRLLVLLIVIAMLGTGAYLYTNLKPHRDVNDELAITTNAITLYEEFSVDEQQANTRYLDKAVLVTGVIDQASKNQDGYWVILLKTNDPFFGVSCTMKELNLTVSKGEQVSVKGFCRGYLSDVILNECELIK